MAGFLGLNRRGQRRKVVAVPQPNFNTKIIMKKNLLFSLMVLAAGPLLAAEASPKENVTAAATALGGEKIYSWHTTVKVPEDSPF